MDPTGDARMERWMQYSQKTHEEARSKPGDPPMAEPLKSELACLRSEYTTLKTEHSGLRSHHLALKSEHLALKSEHTVLKAEHTVLQAEHSALKNERPALKTEHSAPRSENSALLTEHTPLQTQHTALQTQHTALQTQHMALQTQHSAIRTQHSALQTQHTALQTQHTALRTQHTALQTQHSALQTQHKALSDTAEGLRLSCQSAEGRVHLAKQLNADKMQELAAKTKALQERCTSLGALAEQHRIAHARQEAACKEMAEGSSGLKAALASTQAKHGALMNRYEELQKAHAGLMTINSDLTRQGGLQARHDELHAKYAETEKALQARVDALQAKWGESQSWTQKAQGTALQAKHDALQERYAETQKAYAEALLLNSGLEGQLASLKGDLSLLMEGRMEGQGRATPLERELREAKGALQAARDGEAKALKDLETLRSIQRSKESDAQRALAQAHEAGQAKHKALEARLQRAEKEAKLSEALDRASITRDIQKASDALCLASSHESVVGLKSSIREASATLLGLRWRLVHE